MGSLSASGLQTSDELAALVKVLHLASSLKVCYLICQDTVQRKEAARETLDKIEMEMDEAGVELESVSGMVY